jgi:hypothetical protein
MKKPTLKKITNDMIGLEADEPDACVFYLQYDENMTQIMLTIQANRPMTPEEYLHAVTDFVETIKENPAALFVEEIECMDGFH